MSKKLSWVFIFLIFSLYGFGQSVYHNEWIDYSKTYYKIKVMGFGLDTAGAPIRTGIVRIPYTTIAAAGLSSTPAENFQLWRDGEEVPVYTSVASGPLGSNDYIEFAGSINNGKIDKEMYRNPDFQLCDKWSLETDTAAYFLTINATGNNRRYQAVNSNVANNTLPATPYFMYTFGRYFRNISNGFSASIGENLYSSSYDRGEGWVSRQVRPVGGGCGASTLPQNFVRLYPYLSGPQMTLNVNAVGDMQNSRTFKIMLNGDSINTYQMDYINYVRTEDYVDVSAVSSGNASLAIVNQSPSPCDEMRVSTIELTYPRMFNFDGKSVFPFTVDASATGRFLTITNFDHGGVAPVLYDIDNQKRYTTDISSPDTVKVVLDASNISYNLVLTTQSGNYYKEISTVQTLSFTNYANVSNQGNYLIISNPLIYGSGADNYVEQYRQYRSSAKGGSFNAKIIDINELTDQFAWGIKKCPLSIKNFLKFARTNFVDSPKYVFLIGKGVIYNDYRSNESNPLADLLDLVPTWGNPASDNLLASDNNMNATPATPIGRLSAISPQEVGDYLLKVKQHDSIQQLPIHTMDAKGWMKNVLQIAGANDISIGNQIDGYIQNYKSIISDTSFGANVTDFSKTADPAGYPDAVNSFKRIYESGAALITYFGHSSNTSLDFNLDDPANYNNQYKYPIFIANGCSAGNHFLFETNRLNGTTTISEKFILSPERGAIDYIASTHFGIINYLDIYTKDFYKAMGQTRFNQSIGIIMQEAIRSSLASTAPNDYFSRVHAEQYSLHGDPAVVVNYMPLPDYVIETPQITVTPAFVSVADTSFSVKVKVNNIGKATKDAVTLKITRETPGGEMFTVLTKTFPSVYLTDSVTVDIPIIANRDKGINKITAYADYNNGVAEVSDSNNTATIDVDISEDEIRPVYPYNYAIINQPGAKLFASTVNPLIESRAYNMELDTTALFNSAAKISKTVTSVGGVLEFDPAILYQQNVTYYWRVAPATTGQPHWKDFSFVYKSIGGEGFQQGHLYQHLQSSLERLSLDSSTREYSFTSKLHNLFITNSVYPTSGTEDEHFSISVDGSSYIYSACVGASVIFNVFDSLTFKPWANTTNPFGAGAPCSPGREYNFEYSYETPATRKNAMDFLDAIPKGAFVTARIIIDQPYGIYAADWAADTTFYGHNNSLYHRLKEAGFATIDSFYFPRTWAFAYKKGDSTFEPSYNFSDGLYDRITLSVNCHTPNVQGNITSPVFGPARQWNSVNWSGYSKETGSDNPIVNVLGIRPGMTDSVLYSLDNTQHTFNISSVDASLFPQLKLQMSNTDSATATPYQLTNWNISCTPVPEGAVAPNLYLAIPDTFNTIIPLPGQIPGMLHIGLAFKNVSKADFDTLSVKIVLYDSTGGSVTYPINKLRSLAAGDTLHIDQDMDVNSLEPGWYNVFIYVNPDHLQPEQYSFNNFLYKYIYLKNGSTLPVTLLDFNAVLEGHNVNTTWHVGSESNIKQYEVEHSASGTLFKKIGTVIAAQKNSYGLIHNDPVTGKNHYRLKITDKDGKFTYSQERVVELKNDGLIKVYPNPVKDILYINPNNINDQAVQVKIINGYGQQIYLQKATGITAIKTSAWAAGMYLIQTDNGQSKQTFKIQKQ